MISDDKTDYYNYNTTIRLLLFLIARFSHAVMTDETIILCRRLCESTISIVEPSLLQAARTAEHVLF